MEVEMKALFGLVLQGFNFKIKILASYLYFFIFEWKRKGYKPSQTENPSPMA